MERPRAIVIGPDEIPAGYESVVPGSDFDRLDGLARALIASPGWPGSVEILVSEDPGPFLVMLGEFDQEHLARLTALRHELTATRVRYVDYSQAESLAEQLAARLGAVIPDLEDWKFAGIPRGGLIVLGFLAYFLNLRSDQIVGLDSPAGPLVIVDDCALSGTRLRETLERTKGTAVVATLFSVPELRSEFIEREPRILEFVSGADLEDTAPERYGPDYADWLDRWSGRADDYWIGRTDHLVFPWAEPEVAVWNDTVERMEAAWRLVPPDRCLKNRSGTRPSRTIHRFTPATGPVRQAPDVVDLQTGESVTIMDLGSQRTLTLAGPAADMWSALLSTGSVEEAARRVEDLYRADGDQIRRDLEDLKRTLFEEGLIVLDHVDETA